jgi:hypothetical protein
LPLKLATGAAVERVIALEQQDFADQRIAQALDLVVRVRDVHARAGHVVVAVAAGGSGGQRGDREGREGSASHLAHQMMVQHGMQSSSIGE